MKTEARVSVVVPTLNEAGIIEQLLDKLFRQPGLEIIVSDGGSTDSTIAIAESFEVKLAQGSPGRGSQMNRGAKLATGKVILFLHADSSVDTGVWDQIRRGVEQGHKWGCLTLAFDNDKPFYRRLAYFSNQRARWLSSCYGDQGIWCEREFFWEQGGFPDYPLMEDIVFSHRLRRVQRAKVLPGRVTTSARRFEAGGRWRVWVKMQWLKLLHWLGVHPARLASKYR